MNDCELAMLPVALEPDEPTEAEPVPDIALLPMFLKTYSAASLPRVPVVPVADDPDGLFDALDIAPPRSRQPVTVIVRPCELLAPLCAGVAEPVRGDPLGACAITPATDNAVTTAVAPVHVFQCM